MHIGGGEIAAVESRIGGVGRAGVVSIVVAIAIVAVAVTAITIIVASGEVARSVHIDKRHHSRWGEGKRRRSNALNVTVTVSDSALP